MTRRKYKPRKKKPMSEAKKKRLLHYVEHHMSKKDKGRNKKAAMVKYCGVVKETRL